MMNDLDRASALALIAGRLSDYPVIRRLPDDLKAELEPLERGKHYGAIIERLADELWNKPDSLYRWPDGQQLVHALRAAAKAQESRLAACALELENAHERNRDLRDALEKSAFDAEVAAALRRDFPDLARSIEAPILKAREDS